MRCFLGFGSLALMEMLAKRAGEGAIAPHFPHERATCDPSLLSGGVSHVDSWDPKLERMKRHGQSMPAPVNKTVLDDNQIIFASPWITGPQGQSGIACTDLFPHLAAMVNELAIIHSMTSKVSEHAQGNYAFHTGFPFMGRPSAGAWMSYGLGSLNESLPSFVVLQRAS